MSTNTKLGVALGVLIVVMLVALAGVIYIRRGTPGLPFGRLQNEGNSLDNPAYSQSGGVSIGGSGVSTA